jgi:type VI secretion system secreted protein Hcp
MFLKIQGVDGEATDSKHPNWIEVESWSFGVSQGASALKDSTEKPVLQDLAVLKRVDKATPILFLKCCTGEHIPDATLTLRRTAADGDQNEFFIVKLTDCLISSQSISGQGSGDPIPTESISFNFSKIDVTYIFQDEAGGAGGPVHGGWDLKKNQKV